MEMRPKDVLAIPMGPNDADAATVGEYLEKLLAGVWVEEEGFSGKRPFGNSGWKYEVCHALVRAGAIDGTVTEDDEVEDFDEQQADELIGDAIEYAFSQEPR